MIYYFYPQWHKVSFSVISEYHIRELRKYFKLYALDELTLPHIHIVSRPLLILHPYFFNVCRIGRHLEFLLPRIRGLIGVDVADTDKLSCFGVHLTNYATAIIVPSNFAREVYVRSGVKVPVHVVPHGLDKLYFSKKPTFIRFHHYYLKKKKEKKIYLLTYLMHSGYRKGDDLVLEFWSRVKKEYKNLELFIKVIQPDERYKRAGAILISDWLSIHEQIELYDLCDIYLLFSRGGAFELNGLESLARGEVVIAPDKGAWTEFLPKFCLVKSRPSGVIFPDNPIHVGKGFEIDVEKALDKFHDIVNNLDEYKARVREYVDEVVKNTYTWEKIGILLRDIITKYL